ncbi:MAG TPA: DinB family protein [Chloroflexia bacterium]|nr:DinB family protein [Chloroflexia bacterium]
MNDAEQYLQDISALHREVHQQVREAIDGLEGAALNWTPGPETSAIGTIVVHALGAEAEMLRNLLEIPTARDRDAEFAAQVHEPAALLRLLDAAAADWAQLASRLQAGDLRTLRPRPHKPIPQSGLYWLMRNYGHLREHLAQIQLTRQLYLARAT